MSRKRDRYSYDQLEARRQRDLQRPNPFPWSHEPHERCPKCQNGAIEYLTENDDRAYCYCSWCHRKWLAPDEDPDE